jgi:putative membrane-bound dehydrogenase-like protein
MVPALTIAMLLAQAEPEVTVRDGFRMDLFAREPLIADPVAIWLDDSGRVWVAESERQERGVEDNRSSKFWLMDDLRAQSVDDRLAYYRKWADRREGGMDYYEAFSDRIRRIEDRDRDGRGDVTVQFSRDFHDALDGTGAGVLVDGDDVWFTCIPALWRLRDTDGDGVANMHEPVHTGFGIRTALRGHDMHGLVMGPDGRLYWSIGDRGYRIARPGAPEIADTRSGAVFRCRPDGSELEVVCRGLRNPQELAFNEWGDLFTGDNSSDGGDKARFLYLMPGGDSGWDMHAQFLEGRNQRGPWNQEGIWHLRTDDRMRPAWTLPPLAHVSSGPSGLAFVPGTGVPEEMRGAFLLCDFLGSAPESGVLVVRAERDGAGYSVRDAEPLVMGLLATDVAFGPDDRIYISEWGEGWYSTGTGRLQVLSDDAARAGEASQKAQAVLAAGDAGLKALPADALAALLASPDLRVRQKAQFALVARGDAATPLLHAAARGDLAAACGSDDAGLRAALLQRIHAIWALGMQAQGIRGPSVAAEGALDPLRALLEDPDPEIRTQVCRALGDARHSAAAADLASRTLDEDLRVRASAALALARIGPAAREHVPNVTAMLWENEDTDAFLRHAGVVALAGIADPVQLAALASDPFPAVRLGALLALRQRADRAVARFLYDPDPRIVAEAARAIWDIPIREEWPALAALAARWIPQEGAGSAPEAARGAPESRSFTRLAWTRQIWRQTDARARGADGLVSEPAFSQAPTESVTVDEAVGITGAGTRYLQRLFTTFTPAESGAYEFMIACDDDGVLLLGEDGGGSPREIARVSGYVNPGSWDSQPTQRSGPVELVAGKRYTIEARHAQGGGGHHLAIGWIRPDGTVERPIGAVPLDVNLAATLRRVMAANAALGETAHADALAQLAVSPLVPRPLQVESLEALAEFADPPPRDRVLGHVRDTMMRAATDRDGAALDQMLMLRLPQATQSPHHEVRQAALELASLRGISLDPAASAAVACDMSRPVRERVAALGQLAGIDMSGADADHLRALRAKAIDAALASPDDPLRTAARRLMAVHDPSRAARELAHAVEEGTLREQQAAVAMLATLAAVDGPGADASRATLSALVDSLGSGVPAALRLDVREAAERVDGLASKAQSSCPLPDAKPLDAAPKAGSAGTTVLTSQWAAIALEGGDPDAGRQVLQYSSTGSCLRCHALEGTGGHAGPALDGVARRLDPTRLLQSLVDPQAEVAEGYGASSAMPAMGPLLSPREIRDLVAYLRTLDTPSTKGH